ncbi:MAG: EAL domain-containing protein [Massilia sp.]
MNTSPHTAAARRKASALLRNALDRVLIPHIILRSLAVLMLIMIWGATWSFVNAELHAAKQSTSASSRRQADIYEAQVARALREIDQTLRTVRYAYDVKGKDGVLSELQGRDLLLPDLWFVVSITNAQGDVIASTKSSTTRNVAGQDYFEHQRQSDTFFIGRSQRSENSQEWKLNFSRRLTTVDGTFAGIGFVTVLGSYFVSAYEPSQLGEHGMLGIIGTDGAFRIERSGNHISAGKLVGYNALIATAGEPDTQAPLMTNSWDSVPRYTAAHALYGFPAAIVVGLAANEQLVAARAHVRAYLWRASGGSVLLLVVVVLLDRMSRALALSRQRAVEEQISHAKHVEHLAYHDSLTTLPNRSLYSKLLGQTINQAKRNNRQFALLFLDIDRFKHINDTLGHDAGDKLLQEVAIRLKGCLRESDTVSRLGGDEFVVLLPELHEETYAATVAQKILAAIAQPFSLLGQEYRVTTSIGISTFPQAGLDEQTLTKSADVAMYQAKANGKNNFQFYSEQLNTTSLQRLNLESALRRALEKGEFRLHYQAKQDTHTGKITGMEALLRWEHPDMGVVAPMEFLPVADESNLIVSIGKWVLRTACAQNVAWRHQGLPYLIISVNLTARQFADTMLLADLKEILTATGMDPHLLELEIKESVLMSDVGKAMRILTSLRGIGVRIAIDDFGIGYSSLAALRKFPLDSIKIDRSFIRDLVSKEGDKTLASSVIAMGKTLSLIVVGQGVETREQAEFLEKNACDEYQGFYVNEPLPPDRIAGLLRVQSDQTKPVA